MKIFVNAFCEIFSVPFVFAMMALITLYSCEIIDPEPPEPPTPECELEETGNVTVKNRTGYGGYVDCTGNYNTTYDERWVRNGSSTKYRDVDADETKRIWFSLDGDYWIYDTEFLSPCGHLEFTWTNAGEHPEFTWTNAGEHPEFTWTNAGKKSAGKPQTFIIETKSLKTGIVLDVCEVEKWVKKE